MFVWLFVLFKQKTAYDMRISDWSSDVCSSDLQMPVRALDRTIFMRNTAVIAGRLHPVMATQRVISVRQILARRCIQIPERRRQTVAAMLARRAAQRPQGILQPLRQRDITLAAQDHMGMLEARTGEPDVDQPVKIGRAQV